MILHNVLLLELICNMFEELYSLSKKFPLYYVGGYVRHHILSRVTHDLDLAIDAPLTQWLPIIKTFSPYVSQHYESCSFRAGEYHYTISRMRQDRDCDGRNANIIPTHDLLVDALRRDFTINAIYMTLDYKIIDPIGDGVSDLYHRIVRFIGDPRQRMLEDQLRILRYFRLCAWLDVDPDSEIIQIAQEFLPLNKIPIERKRYEWKLIKNMNPPYLKDIERFYIVITSVA